MSTRADGSRSASSTYALRAFADRDAPAVADLLSRYERSLYERSFTTENDVRALSERPRFDPGLDAWMAVDHDGAVVAYAEVWERDPGKLIESLGVVDPAHVDRGLGALILDLHEGRASERTGADATLRNVTPAADRRAADLLLGSGYVWARRFQHMAVDLGSPRQPIDAAPSVVVRRFDPSRDAEAVHRVLQESFEGTWEFKPTTYERWRSTWIDSRTFDAGLWFVAESEGAVIGAVLGMQRPAGGWIIDIGVLPSHRGRGVAAALMSRAFDAFRDRGTAVVELNVDADNPTGAVRLYERLGMTVTRAWDLYDKPLG